MSAETSGEKLKRRLGKGMGMGAFFAFVLVVFAVYRWAYYVRIAPPRRDNDGLVSTVRLERSDFESIIEDRKAWSLFANVIEFERVAGTSLSTVRHASLSQIRKGKLYQLSEENAAKTPVPETVEATFQAEKGQYDVGEERMLPYDLALLFNLKWRFQLTGNVLLKSLKGATLSAPAMSILEMKNTKNGKLEQRAVCDEGAVIETKDLKIQTNKARLNFGDRSVECSQGVRGTLKGGVIQAERAFWQVKESVLFCPDQVSGTWKEMPFRATNLTIDMKRRTLHADRVHMELDLNKADSLLPPPRK